MAWTKVKCAWCGKMEERQNWHINRSYKIGAPLYCGMECAAFGRRLGKTIEQKKEEKRLYDIKYRNRPGQREKKKVYAHDYYRRTHDPVKEAAIRKARMHLHVKYCQQPWYREWKKEYDAKYRAKRLAGEYWESFMLAIAIDKEVKERMSKEEIAVAKGYYNKTQTRRREYEKLIGSKFKEYFVGNFERNQNGQDAPGAGR